MFNLSKEGIISVNRGDTFSTALFINAGTELQPIRYKLGANDKVYFALEEPNQSFECALLVKEYTSQNLNSFGDVAIKFESKDTEFLKSGKYYYEVKAQLYRADGNYAINTVVPKTEFYIYD